MLPLFSDNDTRRKRQINLGGASSAASHSSIIDQAKARRHERDEQRRRSESALRIQAWWRGANATRIVRAQLREHFQANLRNLTGLRCLALLGQDEEALGAWSTAVTGNSAALISALNGPDAKSWIALLKPISSRLMQSLSRDSRSNYSLAHLQTIHALLLPVSLPPAGSPGRLASVVISRYLLQHGFYLRLSSAIEHIPVVDKGSASLPYLVPLITAPFPLFSSSGVAPSPEVYRTAFAELVIHVFAIPLLANRLPIKSIPQLSAKLPLSSFETISSLVQDLPAAFDAQTNGLERRVNIVANLLTFSPPRYPKLSAPALDAYLRLIAALLNTIPSNALEPPSTDLGVGTVAPSTTAWTADSDESDDEERATTVHVVSSFASAPVAVTKPKAHIPKFDARTYKRLAILPAPEHITSLLAASQHVSSTRPALFTLVLALISVWPARRDKVLTAVLAHSGGGIARELYRGWVRSSPLGRESATSASVFNPEYASAWPPFLLLVELYTQTLLTMGDDEFFSSSGSAGGRGGFILGRSSGPSSLAAAASASADSAPPPRNPLTLDELTTFSRQLLNIAFSLYWREDAGSSPGLGASGEGSVPGLGASVKWETVRDRITKCLQAIHARDSRKPFTPPNHWLVTSQIDVHPFVEAALLEGEQVSAATSDLPTGRARGGSRALSKRQVAALSPRLGVLNNIPFAIPFDVRVSVFRGWIARDMIERSGGTMSDSWSQPGRVARMMMRGPGARTRAVVRRGNVAQDGFDRLADADLKAPIEITFIDQWGNEEAGIDGGGVFKEFFTSLCMEVFDTDRGLWLANKKNELYPNPHSYATEAHSLNWYRFIGRILGKALYEGILVDVAFAEFFLAKWIDKQSFLDDLSSLDPDLYQGLIFLKHYSGNPEDLSLNFTVAEEEFGVTKSIDLIANGSNIAVTRENRLQYIYLVSHYRLTKQIKLQSDAFLEGLTDIIDLKWLRMFNQQELQVLLGGVNAPVDVDDLRKNTSYGGLYDDGQETVQLFWKVVNSFDQEQRRKLLRFVTSCSRPPLLGFKELMPNFAIRDAGGDEARLPTSSTCVNLLKLPRYRNERILREKLLQAINANAGFDLS